MIILKKCLNQKCVNTVKKRFNKYCSRTCGQSKPKKSLKEKIESAKLWRIKNNLALFCKTCKKEIISRNCDIFCSKSCASKFSFHKNKNIQFGRNRKEENDKYWKFRKKYGELAEIKYKEWRTVLGKTRKGKLVWNSGKKYNDLLGKEKADKYKEKIRKTLTGRIQTDEERKNHRIGAINYIEKYRGKLKCNVGKNEKKLLDKQEKKDGYKIIRQYHIKGLGYVADGYCKSTNTIYEVYENWHQNTSQRDLRRQNEIENFLKCNFIIIKDE
jgi:very-short-patch-repair endonuclease